MVSRIRVGCEIPPYELTVDPALIGTMAALLEDPVPIHLDPAAVRRLGLGDRLVNQGPMAFGYLVELVRRWAGDVDALRTLRCRFVTHVFAGDRLVCRGSVSDVVEPGVVRLSLEIRRGDDLVVTGDAVVDMADGPA